MSLAYGGNGNPMIPALKCVEESEGAILGDKLESSRHKANSKVDHKGEAT
jgi:hypothetical protein